MADLGDIAVVRRDDVIGEDSPTPTGGDFGREHRDSSDAPRDAPDPRDRSPSCQDRGSLQVDGDARGLTGQTAEGKTEGPMSQQEDARTEFYKIYRKEAEEYDKEFMKKYDEDLNTTLIFAGLFSAVASAFIIVVHSEFQPNLNEETNALIRVMIYTMNNTAFGGEVPTVPQWTGTPPTMVQVQAILVASFCVSLLSALLAMLGKQWLNRCAPANIRGTIIERSQYRQRKLDGMANWYFDHVMESLPLMLQAALLLLGCALSRYLWEYNTTVASVVIGVTSFGVLFYLFIVIAGTVSVNCPYQTPGADFLRHIPDVLGRIPYLLYRVQRIIQGILRHSKFFDVIESFGRFYGEFREAPPFSLCAVTELLCGSFFCILMLLYYLAVDTCWVIAWLLVGFIHQVRQVWLGLQAERQTVTSALGLRCISWTLQTSVEGPVRLLALRYLTTILDGSHPTQAAAVWFDALFDCIKITNGRATVVQGLEELVAASSLLFLCKLSNLMVMDPIPKILEDIRQRYIRTIPSKTRFYNPLVPRTLCVIHVILHTNNAWVDWEGYEPSSDEHIKVAHALTNIARFEYQKSGSAKVPRWLLRFALHSLSQDTLPPASVVTDSLSIIAIDLGCDIPDIVAVNLLDQSAQPERILDLIASQLISKHGVHFFPRLSGIILT